MITGKNTSMIVGAASPANPESTFVAPRRSRCLELVSQITGLSVASAMAKRPTRVPNDERGAASPGAIRDQSDD